ncbi:MAG: hypothetical protein U9R75_01690, partial [Candidatus Thermoplasmatota archaeon]|nr:hypothetical protein [Candidatus Thermoplasmatota archaeon]
MSLIPVPVSGFDMFNENIVYSTDDGNLGVYDINVMYNKVLFEGFDPGTPSIHKNTFCWLNDTGSGNNDVTFYSQFFEIESFSTGFEMMRSSKVIPVDELTSDFGTDVLNYLYGKTVDTVYVMEIHSKTPLDIQVDNLEINMEFIMDPLDPDSDYDDISDGEEIVTFAGVDILECEDAQIFKSWNPTYTKEFLPIDDEGLVTTAGYGFFQSRSVSLISSDDEGTILDSYIKMSYTPHKTGTYRFSLNYPTETRMDKLVGTMVPGNLPKTELLPQGSLNVTDLELNYSEAKYLADTMTESFQMRVYYSYSEINPIEYSNVSTYQENVNIVKVVNLSTDPDDTPEKVAVGELTAEGEYLLKGGETY